MRRGVIGGSLYVAATVLVAGVAAWPIYADARFVLLVIVAAVAATALAVVVHRRRWGGWTLAALLVAAFALLAVPVAVPSRLGGPLEILRGLGEAMLGAVVGWKDLLTVDLPVGDYRNLLVPALVVFLVGTCSALLLAWRDDAWANAAVIPGGAMLAFGLLFGRSATSAPLPAGPLVLHAPVETALGVAGFAAALLWLAWRTHDERARALQRAAGGVRLSSGPSRADRRRGALGAGMLVLALGASAVLVPWMVRGAEREVLRGSAGPEARIAQSVSPLSDYRANFSDARADEVLFTVTADGPLPERVRMATLDAYDGEIFRAGAQDGRFVRVPSARDAGEGARVEATVRIESLSGIWMPTVGQVSAVEFGGEGISGERAAALADGFYYDAEAAAAVQIAEGGVRAGDEYRVLAVEQAVPELTALDAPGGETGMPAAPDNVRRWVESHASGSDGATLAGLVTLLRERGFLSHALSIGEERPVWAQALPDYSFQPSAAGHSLARIDAMFARLLERESDPKAAAAQNLVAAIGDDEQFAVATALIAGELGFPARVVVGVRLNSDDPDLPTCDAGRCLGQDLTAWTEVRGAEGEWVPVDVSPQWTQSPSLEVTEERDPENVTDVRPDRVEEVVPPKPVQEDSARSDDEDDADAVDLAWLWPVLRVVGIVLVILAIVLGPFLTVLGAKAVRRRGRRRTGPPAERIAGGWEEYVDAGVDAGHDPPRALTRSEIAVAYATPSGAALAATADRAIFSSEPLADGEAEQFWRLVDAERRTMTRERGVWHRLRAAVSLRSFVRLVAPPVRRTASRNLGRGKRRPRTGGRTTT